MTMKDFLLEHASKDPVSFHMPGHKGSKIFREYGYGDFLERFVDCDITEIPGADNLFQTEGIIKEAQDGYARIYGVDRSYLLINGTSTGIISAILTAVKPGEKLIMARNCHKSVFNAVLLGQIEPVYAKPELLEDRGITGAVRAETIESLIKENPDAKAVILPSPNYYGICSPIDEIAEAVHRAGMVLIVDQAHGAHLKFFHKYGCGKGMPVCAEDQGADIVINSIHKTLASLTQSAVLNMSEERVDRHELEDKLQMIQSTSPSYILMSFLDINRELLENHGAEAMGRWREAIDYFYGNAEDIPGLRVMKNQEGLDITKINLDMSELGIDGGTLEEKLMEQGIFSELYTGNILMLMTGIGNTCEHMERTLKALREIAESHGGGNKSSKSDAAKTVVTATDKPTACEAAETEFPKSHKVKIPETGKLHKVPREKTWVHVSEAAGRVSAASLIPYPPGIPFVCPGEEITEEAISYLMSLRKSGEKVIGITDEEKVLVERR